MLKKVIALGVLLTIVAALAACGSSGDNNAGAPEASITNTRDEASTGATSVTLNDDYADALPVSAQLAIGTLLLEATEDAVTVEQAGELLPSWQMLDALEGSGTAAQAELDTVLSQIQRAMTPQQLTAIKKMELTPISLRELAQERGFSRGAAGGTRQSGGIQPPAGVNPGSAGGPGGGLPGAGPGQGTTNEEGKSNALIDGFVTDAVIELLTARAAGEAFEIAVPNQEFELQRALLGAVTEVAATDQQDIVSQVREGKTLAEIAAANGADLDEIVSQVVAAETERVNQAVADGSLEQADADRALTDLEARVEEMLKGTLQFGNRIIAESERQREPSSGE